MCALDLEMLCHKNDDFGRVIGLAKLAFCFVQVLKKS
jgi:hypothetical protein